MEKITSHFDRPAGVRQLPYLNNLWDAAEDYGMNAENIETGAISLIGLSPVVPYFYQGPGHFELMVLMFGTGALAFGKFKPAMKASEYFSYVISPPFKAVAYLFRNYTD